MCFAGGQGQERMTEKGWTHDLGAWAMGRTELRLNDMEREARWRRGDCGVKFCTCEA